MYGFLAPACPNLTAGHPARGALRTHSRPTAARRLCAGGYNINTSNEQDTSTRPTAGQSVEWPRLRVGLTYDAAGSHKTANGVWRGGVALGSLGDAK